MHCGDAADHQASHGIRCTYNREKAWEVSIPLCTKVSLFYRENKVLLLLKSLQKGEKSHYDTVLINLEGEESYLCESKINNFFIVVKTSAMF